MISRGKWRRGQLTTSRIMTHADVQQVTQIVDSHVQDIEGTIQYANDTISGVHAMAQNWAEDIEGYIAGNIAEDIEDYLQHKPEVLDHVTQKDRNQRRDSLMEAAMAIVDRTHKLTIARQEPHVILRASRLKIEQLFDKAIAALVDTKHTVMNSLTIDDADARLGAPTTKLYQQASSFVVACHAEISEENARLRHLYDRELEKLQIEEKEYAAANASQTFDPYRNLIARIQAIRQDIAKLSRIDDGNTNTMELITKVNNSIAKEEQNVQREEPPTKRRRLNWFFHGGA
eukprot:gnl/TRDRNA2_/TRDRNA2_135482_c0_seq1.p1 gnl/TRDRNA2_/TRDRNA2_135482_c0~~gnl/TRDRNA2_/TRDRNA2_135482_c0_seq1.p1  ORF type:complete len:288 (+),score=69.08 gnl/TRDRNA2_/TRDRNA2_135482_c0_seq1:28-891(+)